MALSANDYIKALDLVEVIYSSSNRESMFQAFCDELQRLIPFPSAALLPLNPKTSSFIIPDSIAYNLPFESNIRFCLYYAPLHPVVAHGLHAKKYLGNAVRLTDLISSRCLPDTEYSRDFQSPSNFFYELCVQLRSKNGLIGGIGFHRSRKDCNFGQRDAGIIDILTPHLSRAIENIDLVQKGVIPDGRLRSRLLVLELTRRQQEVAFLVMQGLSNREIARRLYISEQTVKDHIYDIFEKLKIRRRAELAAKVLGVHSDAF